MALYRITFQYSETTYCTNLAEATDQASVNAYYTSEGYQVIAINEATESDRNEAERKGMPIVSIKDFSISDIEALTYEQVENMSEEMQTIKGHQVYFVDFGGYFKYSVLVFRDKHHLYYADDYELHHSYMKDREELKKYYIEEMQNRLFDDASILAPLTDYTEKERRINYLNNYYPLLCDDKVSAFNIFHDDSEREEFRKKVENMYYCGCIGFFYTSNPAFVRRLEKLYSGVIKASEQASNSPEYWFNAFKYEMYNHEYAINWQGDYDVCSCFCHCEYGEYKTGIDYLREAGFDDTVVSAYCKAKSEVMRNSDY